MSSAIGAVTGNGVFSELIYKGIKFKVAQWYNDAMGAVSETAYLRTADALKKLGGTPKAIAEREVALARTFALGGFDFDGIVADNGLINSKELLTTFLYKLLVVHDATVTFELAKEMVDNEWVAVAEAIGNANPQKLSPEDKTGQAGQNNPATPSTESGTDSRMLGETIGM